MKVNPIVTCFHVLMFVYITQSAFYGIRMCKSKCCRFKCYRIYYSSEHLSCRVVIFSLEKCESVKQITCSSQDLPKEDRKNHQKNRRSPCLTLLPQPTVPETLQRNADIKSEPVMLPLDVKKVICQPRAIGVPMRFDPRFVHHTCSLINGVLGIKRSEQRAKRRPSRRKGRSFVSQRQINRRNWGQRRRRRPPNRIKGTLTVKNFFSNGNGSQRFGVRFNSTNWVWNRSSIRVLELSLCTTNHTKENNLDNSICSGFSLTLSRGMLRVTSKHSESKHQNAPVEEIEMKISKRFAVVIRNEQSELFLLDMAEKRILGKCDALIRKAPCRFVVKLNVAFPIHVKFESLDIGDLCS